MIHILRYAAVAILIASFPALCGADIVIGFDSNASLSSKSVQVGEQFSVDLYYVETTTSLAPTNGLFSFGTRGTFSSTLLQFDDGTVDSVFEAIGGGSNPDGSVAGQVDVFGASPSGAPKSLSIHLATLNFTAVSAGTAVISFGDLDPGFNDFSLDDDFLTTLDPIVYGPMHLTHNFTVNVSAVPEPSSVALTSTGLLLGGFLVYRSRRNGSRMALSHSGLST
jgi:hypothetical protein